MYKSKLSTSLKNNSNPVSTSGCTACGYGCGGTCMYICSDNCDSGCSLYCGETCRGICGDGCTGSAGIVPLSQKIFS
jgi:hypothetical protein